MPAEMSCSERRRENFKVLSPISLNRCGRSCLRLLQGVGYLLFCEPGACARHASSLRLLHCEDATLQREEKAESVKIALTKGLKKLGVTRKS